VPNMVEPFIGEALALPSYSHSRGHGVAVRACTPRIFDVVQFVYIGSACYYYYYYYYSYY
jgi:hypothetical protein